MKAVEMDIRGQVCPSSLLLVLREVNQKYAEIVAGGCCLVILTDNRDSTGTIPAAVNNMGFSSIVDRVDGVYRIMISQRDQEGENV